MGQSLVVFRSGFDRYFHPDIVPGPEEHPTFDPHLGFDKPRKERSIKLTKEEMVSAKIPLENRDFCVDKLLDYKVCRRENFPWIVNCSHEKHVYLTCKYDDFVIRMKEYEREKRLRVKVSKGELQV